MTAEIVDGDPGIEMARAISRARNFDGRRSRLQISHSPVSGVGERSRLGDRIELRVESPERPLHQKVRADKLMVQSAFPIDREYARNGRGSIDRGHVAVLAGLLVTVIAVQPFRIGHLLVERANLAPVRIARSGDERMAGGAEPSGYVLLDLAQVRPWSFASPL